MTKNVRAPDGFNILVSSAGRRVALIDAFRAALRALEIDGSVFAADVSRCTPAAHRADEWFEVPRCMTPEFIPRMLELCRENRVRLVVPTIDPELPVWAANRELFAGHDITVLISTPEVIAIGSDKVATHAWLTAENFPTVAQMNVSHALASPPNWPFPLYVKPRRGSSSEDVFQVHGTDDLVRAARDRDDLLVQQFAQGEEYTISVLADRCGRCRCAVPRRRLEVRAGEVSKARTVRSHALESLAADVCRRLPGAYGPLNLQVMHDRRTEQMKIIELNPRFGGGCPLAFAAGADFPLWLIAEVLDIPVQIDPEGWRNDLVMLRYDEAVFVDGSEAGDAA